MSKTFQTLVVPAGQSRDTEATPVRSSSTQFCVYIDTDEDVDVEVFRVQQDNTLISQMEDTPQPATAGTANKFVFYESVHAIVVRVDNGGLNTATVKVEMIDGGAS